MQMDMWGAVVSGVAVAACCGLRAFLPLCVIGLASRVGLLEVRGGLEWLASDTALIALTVATVVEIVADKIPVVDHVLDGLATVLRPAAAGLGSYAVLAGWPDPWAPLTALTLGGMALGIHSLKSGLRLGSTASTAGLGNPVVSVIEDGIAVLLLAIVVLGSLALFAVLALGLWWGLRRRATAPSWAPAPAPLSRTR